MTPGGLTGRNPLSMLQAEAKRRPEIQDLINRIHEISDEELATVKVPLPWYRKALIQLKKSGKEAETMKAVSAQVLQHVIEVPNADPDGTIREWIEGSTFVELDRGHIEVHFGALIWFPHSGGVWIDTIFAKRIDPRFASSRFVAEGSKSDYNAAVAAKRCGAHTQTNLPFTVVAGQEGPRNTNPLFRIERL